MPPLISVVVPTFNESSYISHCISSLNRQTFRDFEVVAVDLSSDSTPSLCRQAGWTVLRQKEAGIAAARAEGFAAASGSIIASTDVDTVVHAHWLENISAAFTDPKVVCVYGPTFLLPVNRPLNRLLGYLGLLFLWINKLFGNDQIFGMNFAVRKSAYLSIGGFNKRLTTAEDIDLGYRLKKVGQIKYSHNVIVFSSDRRLAKLGFIKFFIHHTKNYLGLLFFGKVSSNFDPIR